jgi:hypothetical protein
VKCNLLITTVLPGIYLSDFPFPFNLDSLSQCLNKHSLWRAAQTRYSFSTFPLLTAYLMTRHSIHSPDTFNHRSSFNELNTDYRTTNTNICTLKNFIHSFDLLNLCSTPKSSVSVGLTFIYLWVINLATQNMAVRIPKVYTLG